MKKLLVLVFTVVLIPLVEAVSVFGMEVSMLVLTPVVLILIFLIIFIFMIVRDKMKKKGKDKESPDKLEPFDDDILGEDPLTEEELPLSDEPLADESLSEDSPPSKEAPKANKKDAESKVNYLKEIEALKKELKSKDPEETDQEVIDKSNKKVSDLIKKFFGDYASIKYKFTFKELENELKKRNKKVVCFSDNLSLINYGPKGASYDDALELINEFKDILEATSEEELQAIPEFKKETEEKKKKIGSLLKKGEKLIKKDINQARGDYKEILSIYDTLISVEKEKIRPLIMDFYNKLNQPVIN